MKISINLPSSDHLDLLKIQTDQGGGFCTPKQELLGMIYKMMKNTHT